MRRSLVLWIGAFALGCGDDAAPPADSAVPGADTGRLAVCADPPRSRELGAPCECELDCLDGALCSFEDVEGYPGGACVAVCDLAAPACPSGGECLDLGGAAGLCRPSCVTTSDCPGPGRICSSDARCYFLCQADLDCLSGHCDPYTGLCTDGTPGSGKGSLEPCVRDDECRSGACEAACRRCVSGCSVMRQGCPEGEACVESLAGGDHGVCQPRCMVDAECSALGLVCRTTSTAAGTFRVCVLS